MRKGLVALALLVCAGVAGAADVYVKPYYRKDGTYVPGHYRSAPDDSRANNYGRPGPNDARLDLRTRDQDDDGIDNQFDPDDDNDGILDDDED